MVRAKLRGGRSEADLGERTWRAKARPAKGERVFEGRRPELASGRAWPTRVVRATSSEGRAAPQRRQSVAGPSTGSGTGKEAHRPFDRLRDREGAPALRQAQGPGKGLRPFDRLRVVRQAHQPGDPSLRSG